MDKKDHVVEQESKFEGNGNFRKKLLKKTAKCEDMVNSVWDSHISDRTCGGSTRGMTMNRCNLRTLPWQRQQPASRCRS